MGADICALSRLRPDRQVENLSKHAVSVLYATPTQLRLLVKNATVTLPNMRRIFSGGGKLDAALCSNLNSLCPNAQIREFFGASETSFVTITDAGTPINSVGKPYPNVTLRIGSKATDGIGEVWIKSPYLFDGYANGHSEDTNWDGDYLSIGEIGRLDAKGNLFLVGRKNRMITVADHNVFPEKIEQTLSEVPGVEHCAVIASPDVSRGNMLTCFVVLSQEVTIKSLRAHCRQKLTAQSVPRDFVILTEMPLLAAGKPDLSMLKNRLNNDA